MMTRKEKIKSGFYEEDRGGELELTAKGRQHFCKHQYWLIKYFDQYGSPSLMECINCRKQHKIKES